jgi:hypothetical protein
MTTLELSNRRFGKKRDPSIHLLAVGRLSSSIMETPVKILTWTKSGFQLSLNVTCKNFDLSDSIAQLSSWI